MKMPVKYIAVEAVAVSNACWSEFDQPAKIEAETRRMETG
jgi:hypothetical protein